MSTESMAKEIVIAMINNNRLETVESVCEALKQITTAINQLNR